jgi:hypothetical protein
MEAWLQHLLTQLALPEYGLSTVFVVAFVSATLLPMGSEPAVFGLVKLNPDLFWSAVLVATAGNTLGSDVEQEVQHVAVLDDVLLAFGAHLAGVLGALLALVGLMKSS